VPDLTTVINDYRALANGSAAEGVRSELAAAFDRLGEATMRLCAELRSGRGSD
jgi:plasmid stabilization system protein ParE